VIFKQVEGVMNCTFDPFQQAVYNSLISLPRCIDQSYIEDLNKTVPGIFGKNRLSDVAYEVNKGKRKRGEPTNWNPAANPLVVTIANVDISSKTITLFVAASKRSKTTKDATIVRVSNDTIETMDQTWFIDHSKKRALEKWDLLTGSFAEELINYKSMLDTDEEIDQVDIMFMNTTWLHQRKKCRKIYENNLI